MNMLIAIMGETFNQNNEVKKRAQVQAHLRFVIDNIWMNALPNSQKISYLIAAFLNEEENDDVAILQTLKEDLANMNTAIRRNNQNVLTQVQALQNDVNQLVSVSEC